jgi:hypothetical protein
MMFMATMFIEVLNVSVWCSILQPQIMQQPMELGLQNWQMMICQVL